MTSGHGARWAAREFDREAWNGYFRFPNWRAFSEEFQEGFLPLHFEAIAANALEAVCYQGKRSVSEYLDKFLNLVEDSRNTDPKIIVVKFHRGLNRRISAAPGRPSDADPDAWFSFAIQMEQDFAAEANPSTPVRSGVVCQTPAFIDEATCVSATPEATFHSSTPAEEASGDPASADRDIRASALSEKVGCSPSADDPSAPTPVSEAPPRPHGSSFLRDRYPSFH
ncbi:MAG TPA: hypothetical protein VF944_09135 [Candidatus Bathyarchaeia archaeon]